MKQKQKEGELATKEENVRKYEAQLAQVKTNKEYSSLQSEINSLKADNSLLEEVIIRLMDDVLIGQRKVEEQKKRSQVKEAEFQQKSKELNEKSAVVKGEIESLEKLRQEKIKDIHPEIASLYDHVVQKRRGIAIVTVEGDVCPACQMRLRPQVINEAKLKEKIVTCESCSRILYSE